MYAIKPIIHNNVLIDLPSCMYSMKSVYGSNAKNACDDTIDGIAFSTTTTADKSSVNKMQILEQRQQRILQQLKELKEKLMSMHKELHICAKPAQPMASTVIVAAKPINVKYLQDIVINANPKNVPFSLLGVKRIWQDRLRIVLRTYTHSTVSDLTDEANRFSTQMSLANDELASTASPTLNITLIWKNVTNTELNCSSGSLPCSYTINGEMNVLRYLMRIGPNEFAHESVPMQCSDIDATLDACHRLVRLKSGMAKEKQTILKFLCGKLGKNQYFSGDVVTLSDIAVSSTLKQCANAKELPPALAKWLAKVTDYVRY